MKKINHFINGKEYISKSDRFGDIFNPASGEKIGSVSFANKDDVALTVLPLFHIFGQNCIMNAAIFAGIANVLLERFEADTIVQLIQKHRVSIFAGVPTMFWSLLNETSAITKKEISLLKKHWRIALSGGAAIPIELLNDFEKTYGVETVSYTHLTLPTNREV